MFLGGYSILYWKRIWIWMFSECEYPHVCVYLYFCIRSLILFKNNYPLNEQKWQLLFPLLVGDYFLVFFLLFLGSSYLLVSIGWFTHFTILFSELNGMFRTHGRMVCSYFCLHTFLGQLLIQLKNNLNDYVLGLLNSTPKPSIWNCSMRTITENLQ